MPRRAAKDAEVAKAGDVEVLAPETEAEVVNPDLKIPTVPIPSDDCAVTLGGVDYFFHVGEHIDVIPGFTVGEVGMLKASRELGPKMAAIEGDDNEAEEQMVLISGNLDEAVALCQEKIYGWDWTDKLGRPYPQPIDDPDVFKRLDTQEIYWLVKAAMGETDGAEKNG